jgi:hypothetical protein
VIKTKILYFLRYGKFFLMFFPKNPMFHVEHRIFMLKTLLLIALACLVGCTKPNPHPELADDIYLDLQAQAGSAKKEAEEEKKKLEGFKKDLDAVIPQTGAIKYAQKRFFESEAKSQRLEQAAKYFELKVQSRLTYTKTEYMKAFRAGKPWPTPEEIASYKKYKELASRPLSWDSRKRVQSYEKENGITPSGHAGEKGEKKAETKSAGE